MATNPDASLHTSAPTSANSGAAVRRRNNVTELGDPSARTLLLAHGFGCSQEVWRKVAPDLARDFHVVLFDHVGAGGSDLSAYDAGKYDSLDGYADDVVEIVDGLGLRDVVYIGHSVSSMVGVLASTRRPDLFSALILVGPSARYVNDGDYVGGFEQADIDSLLDALDANYLGWSADMAPLIMGNSERPELGQELTASFCRIDPAIARQFARVTFLSDNRDDLPAVTTPTLVLQCADDIIAPTTVGRFVNESIPGSRMVLMKTRGHIPNLSGSDELIGEIRSYLK